MHILVQFPRTKKSPHICGGADVLVGGVEVYLFQMNKVSISIPVKKTADPDLESQSLLLLSQAIHRFLDKLQIFFAQEILPFAADVSL